MSKQHEERSPQALGRMVRELVAKGRTLDEAVEEVFAKVRTNGLAGWWEAVGHWAIKLAERELLRRNDPSTTPAAHRQNGAMKVRSWRDRYSENPALVWDMEVPLGDGIRKRAGDLTREDLHMIRDRYVAASDTLRFRGEYFGQIGDSLVGEETLQGAYEAGRVTEAHVQFLAERGRVGEAFVLTAGAEEGAA